MGVKGFFSLVKKFAPNSINEIDLQKLRGEIVVIDIVLYIYRWHSVGLSRNIRGMHNGVPGAHCNHLQGLFFFLVGLFKNGIRPVCYFEGEAPVSKLETLANRRARPNRIRVYHLVDDCKKLLTLMGVSYYTSAGEAEAQCARVVSAGYATAALTEDSDALAFGASQLIYQVDLAANSCQQIVLADMLRDLQLSYPQLVDLCVLLGNDYNRAVFGASKALSTIRQYKELGAIPEIDKLLPDWSAARQNYTQPVFSAMRPRVNKDAQRSQVVSKNRQKITDFLLSHGIVEKKIQNALDKIS